MNEPRSPDSDATGTPASTNAPAPGQTKKFERLREVLREMFQLDRGDLDFGLYRIMNLKRAEVERFLSEDLLPQAGALVGRMTQEERVQLDRRLHELERRLGVHGVKPEHSEEYLGLLSERDELAADDLTEGDIYNRLASFFERYYKDGDFTAQRRYSSGGHSSYLIPYDGEEVTLHWANTDQYYIKTTENYAAYVFHIGNGTVGLRVRFEIAAADNTRDNIQETSDRTRRFLLARGRNAATIEDEDLVVSFEHRPLTDGEKRRFPGNGNNQQLKINEDAAARIRAAAPPNWLALLSSPEPTEGWSDRTTLDRHLAAYTAKNSFDYFIHKDLGGFLRRELDLYLKSEVLNVEDLEMADRRRLRRALTRMKAIRVLGEKIIVFLAQLEDFQKRLWLKKKFVLETQYCVTLDRVSKELYGEIARNTGQRGEWERLYAISEIATDSMNERGGAGQLTEEFLRANPYLVLDTRHFDQDFKDRLLAGLSKDGPLDDAQDGLLIHGENFQALTLLTARYVGQIDCIYIDPPYNTGKGDFPYKDSYQRSSWLSMMHDRMSRCFDLLRQSGSFVSHIDEHELHNMQALISQRFGPQGNVGPVIWDKKNPKGDPKGIATQHEYICWGVRESLEGASLSRIKPNGQRILDKAAEIVARSRGVTDLARDQFRRWVRAQSLSGGEAAYREIDDEGRVFRPVSMAWPNRKEAPQEYFAPLVHPRTGQPCPVPERGWRSPPSTMRRLLEAGEILFGVDETTQPQRKYLLAENLTEKVPSLYPYGGSDDHLQRRIGYSFENAKPLTVASYVVGIAAPGNGAIIVDCFAGSGVTAHAAMDLHRRDGCRRRYVLVEMADHFDSVLLPRLKKVVYSHEWKDGKPVSRTGISQFFRYLRLESYEDTMDSLTVVSCDPSLFAVHPKFAEDYRLRYALTSETNGSACLLGTDFEDPFAYTLSVVRDGERRETPVDLAETFNLLLGLREASRRRLDGVLAIEGVNADGERCLILWRNRRQADNASFDAWFEAHRNAFAPFDRIYANGDHTLGALAREGDSWTATTIEPTFRRLMFDEA